MRSLCWKNWMLKRRAPLSTAAEVLLPVLVMLLLVWVKRQASRHSTAAVEMLPSAVCADAYA